MAGPQTPQHVPASDETESKQAVAEADSSVNAVPTRIAKNVGWNFLGQVLPGIVGLVATPTIVHGFGDVRFGLLTLAWLVVGYFSLFDFGLGRAVTHAVASALTSNDDEQTGQIVWTSLYLLGVFGVVGGIVLAVVAPWVVTHLLHVSPDLQSEALQVFLILALSVPFVVVATGLRGVLEGAQAFSWSNAFRIPLGVLGFLIPVATLRVSRSLAPTIWGLLAVRVVTSAALFWGIGRVLPGVRRPRPFTKASAQALLRFGAWITVSNIVSPLMVSMDRFVVGSMISLAMVTYYATPFEAISRVLIIPGAVGAVIFPALASAYNVDRGQMVRVYRTAGRAIFAGVFPVALVAACFAPELLRLWLGGAFPERSSLVLRVFTIGIAFNSLAYVPYALVQSVGRSDLTAKTHIAELVVYIALLFGMIKVGGINGAAVAWTARVFLDCVILTALALRVAHEPVRAWMSEYAPMMALLATLFAVSALPSFVWRSCAGAALGGVFATFVWRHWIGDLPAGFLQGLLRRDPAGGSQRLSMD